VSDFKRLQQSIDYLAHDTKILLVDDSKLQLKIVGAYLQKWGFDAVHCLSAKDALQKCHKHKFDMVISDWVMPEMDGLEFCKAFKKLETDRYGYFILLTSKSAKEEVVEGLAQGADDFLSKPVNQEELFARIQAGQRVLGMQQKLQAKNQEITDTLNELQTLHDEIHKDLIEAEHLQMSLLPEPLTKLEQGDVSILFQSSGHVGGDLIGFFKISKTRLGLYSIDVSGHGISSALLTARLAGYLNPNTKAQNVAFERTPSGGYEPRSPAQVARSLNKRMLKDMETEHYFTMAYADIDLETGHTSFVQAGHPYPIIVRANNTTELVGTGGPPIGLISGANYVTETLELKQGDRLFLYSDGITECQNCKDALYDEDRLCKSLLNHTDHKGLEYLNDIIWDVTQFADGHALYDDLSAILFEFSK